MDYAARRKYDEPGRARRYARRSAARDAAEWRLVERALARLPRRPHSALDVPCGTGRMAARLLDLGIPTVAADLSPAMRALAAEALAGRPGFGGVFALDLEQPGAGATPAAELVLCFRFLPHLPGPAARARVLGTLRRLTGRWLFLSFHHPVSGHNLGRALRRLLGRPGGDRRTIWPARLAAEARAAGFVLRRLLPLSRYRRELWLAHLEGVDPPPPVGVDPPPAPP